MAVDHMLSRLPARSFVLELPFFTMDVPEASGYPISSYLVFSAFLFTIPASSYPPGSLLVHNQYPGCAYRGIHRYQKWLPRHVNL